MGWGKKKKTRGVVRGFHLLFCRLRKSTFFNSYAWICNHELFGPEKARAERERENEREKERGIRVPRGPERGVGRKNVTSKKVTG